MVTVFRLNLLLVRPVYYFLSTLHTIVSEASLFSNRRTLIIVCSAGLDGKSFTWTPTESDLSPFAGSGTVLRLLDRKDSVRMGVSGTFNVDSPQV